LGGADPQLPMTELLQNVSKSLQSEKSRGNEVEIEKQEARKHAEAQRKRRDAEAKMRLAEELAKLPPELQEHKKRLEQEFDRKCEENRRQARDRARQAEEQQLQAELGDRIAQVQEKERRVSDDCKLALRQNGLAGGEDAASPDLQQRNKDQHDDRGLIAARWWSEDDARELGDRVRKLGARDVNLSSEFYLKPFFQQLQFQSLHICELDPDVTSFSRLTILDVSRNPLQRIDSLPPNLTRLKAYNTGVKQISCLPVPSLVFLGLGHSHMGDEGLEQASRRFPGLLVLDVSYSNVCGLQQAATSLAALPRLKQLCLGGNPVSILPHSRLQLIDRVSQLQSPGAVLDGVPVTDVEVADVQRSLLPKSDVRLDKILVAVQPLKLSGARVLLDVVAKRLRAKRAVTEAVTRGNTARRLLADAAAAEEVAKAAAADVPVETDPKAKKGKELAPGEAEAAAAAEAAKVAEEAVAEAARTCSVAIDAIVAAGKAAGEPPVVYARTASEAAAEAATAHGKSAADVLKAWSEAARVALAAKGAPSDPADAVGGEDLIVNACTSGYTTTDACSLSLRFDLPDGVEARTSELRLTEELAKSGGEPFDGLDLSELSIEGAGPLIFEVDVHELNIFDQQDGKEEPLLRVCKWLRRGMTTKVVFREASPPTEEELAAAAEAAAAEAAKAKKPPDKKGQEESTLSSAPEPCDVPPAKSLEHDAFGGAVVPLDAFLWRPFAVVPEETRESGELASLPPPIEMALEVPVVPMHQFLEPNVQVPSAEPVLRKAAQAEMEDLKRRLAVEKNPTQCECLREQLQKCQLNISRLQWGGLGEPKAAALSLRVVLYAEKTAEPDVGDADAEA
jgi:hypothetical protein